MTWPMNRSERKLVKQLLKIARLALVEVVCLLDTRDTTPDQTIAVGRLKDAILTIDKEFYM